jgi:hypothetical protein
MQLLVHKLRADNMSAEKLQGMASLVCINGSMPHWIVFPEYFYALHVSIASLMI